MQRIALVASLFASTAWADKVDSVPKDAAVIDRMAAAVERQVHALYAARGNCAKLVAALDATADDDKKIVAELDAATSGPDAKALEEYGKKKYGGHIAAIGDNLKRSTIGCRSDAALVKAWKHNALAIGTWGELPAEEKNEKAGVPKPAGYDEKRRKLDAALEAYIAIGDKFDGVDNQADCTDRAKLIPAYAAAFEQQSAAFDALDKKMQDAVLAHDTLMHFQMDAYFSYTATRGKCSDNKAFVKAAKAAKVWK